VHRQHDESKIRMPGSQVAQEGQRIAARKGQVEHEDVGSGRRHEVEGTLSGGGFADDLESLVSAKDEPQALPNEMMVVDEADPDRATGGSVGGRHQVSGISAERTAADPPAQPVTSRPISRPTRPPQPG
jgi:hypothetical protein